MVIKLLKEIARPQWMDILVSLKRSQGKTIGEIRDELGTSYMGLRQHCESMVKLGLLETFRRPRPVGRPERLFRLTAKVQPLFPAAGNEVVLDLLKMVGEVYGHAAPEKLLYNFFLTRTQNYKAKVKGVSVEERAASLAKIRDLEGYLSQLVGDKHIGLHIEEYHHPMEELCQVYPVLLKAEERMFEQILGTRVTREQRHLGGHTVQIFHISVL